MSSQMEHPGSSIDRRETYSYGSQVRPGMASRSAQTHAAFFLSYLQPGMSLVDCGSGSGSITVDLAARIAPGEVLGIDISENAVSKARTLAETHKVSNVRFEQASIYAIPCADESVDAVFIHAVLHHLREPMSALRETMRVLKPGGVVAMREPNFGTHVVGPSGSMSADVEEFLRLWARIIEINGGNPYLGRDVRNLLHEAGYQNIVATASYESHGSPTTFDSLSGELQAIAPEGLLGGQFLAHKLIDHEQLVQLHDTVARWFNHPGAFLGRPWCEAVGRKP